MIIRFIGIDGLSGNELKQMFSSVKYYDFIKNVKIGFHHTWDEEVDIYDVNVEIEPDRDVSVHIFDDFIYITEFGCRPKAFIPIGRTDYARLEII